MNKSETAGGGPLLAEDYRKARKEVITYTRWNVR